MERLNIELRSNPHDGIDGVGLKIRWVSVGDADGPFVHYHDANHLKVNLESDLEDAMDKVVRLQEGWRERDLMVDTLSTKLRDLEERLAGISTLGTCYKITGEAMRRAGAPDVSPTAWLEVSLKRLEELEVIDANVRAIAKVHGWTGEGSLLAWINGQLTDLADTKDSRPKFRYPHSELESIKLVASKHGWFGGMLVDRWLDFQLSKLDRVQTALD